MEPKRGAFSPPPSFGSNPVPVRHYSPYTDPGLRPRLGPEVQYNSPWLPEMPDPTQDPNYREPGLTFNTEPTMLEGGPAFSPDAPKLGPDGSTLADGTPVVQEMDALQRIYQVLEETTPSGATASFDAQAQPSGATGAFADPGRLAEKVVDLEIQKSKERSEAIKQGVTTFEEREADRARASAARQETAAGVLKLFQESERTGLPGRELIDQYPLPEDVPRSQLRQSFTHTLFAQTPKLYVEGMKAAANAVGQSAETEATLKSWQDWIDRNAPAADHKPRVDNFMTVWESGSVNDAMDYLAFGVGSALGSMAPTVAGAAAGAAVAGPAGAMAGGFATSYLQSVGSVHQQIAEEVEEMKADVSKEKMGAIALSAGVLMAGLDAFGVSRLLGEASKAVRGQVIRNIVGAMARGASTEGITEALQATIEQMTAAAVSGKEAFTAERAIAIANEGFVGMLGGTVISGGTGAYGAARAEQEAPERQDPAAIKAAVDRMTPAGQRQQTPPQPTASAGAFSAPPAPGAAAPFAEQNAPAAFVAQPQMPPAPVAAPPAPVQDEGPTQELQAPPSSDAPVEAAPTVSPTPPNSAAEEGAGNNAPGTVGDQTPRPVPPSPPDEEQATAPTEAPAPAPEAAAEPEPQPEAQAEEAPPAVAKGDQVVVAPWDTDDPQSGTVTAITEFEGEEPDVTIVDEDGVEIHNGPLSEAGIVSVNGTSAAPAPAAPAAEPQAAPAAPAPEPEAEPEATPDPEPAPAGALTAPPVTPPPAAGALSAPPVLPPLNEPTIGAPVPPPSIPQQLPPPRGDQGALSPPPVPGAEPQPQAAPQPQPQAAPEPEPQEDVAADTNYALPEGIDFKTDPQKEAGLISEGRPVSADGGPMTDDEAAATLQESLSDLAAMVGVANNMRNAYEKGVDPNTGKPFRGKKAAERLEGVRKEFENIRQSAEDTLGAIGDLWPDETVDRIEELYPIPPTMQEETDDAGDGSVSESDEAEAPNGAAAPAAEQPVREPSGGGGESGPGAVPADPGSQDDGGSGESEAAASGDGAGDGDQSPDGEPDVAAEPAGIDGDVKGVDYVIEPGALDEKRGAITKARDNIAAIKLLKKIQAAGRQATVEEQQVLAKYVGWGTIAPAFPDPQSGKFGSGFEKIGPEVRELLTDSEYAAARESIQYAFYTSEPVMRAMWAAAEQFGFKGGTVLELGMGTGGFVGTLPPSLQGKVYYRGMEREEIAAGIAKLLYPKQSIRTADVTQVKLPTDFFDLVIGNPPFANTVIGSDPDYVQEKLRIHNYFIAKQLDALRPGGVAIMVTSQGTLNSTGKAQREALAKRADFIGAVRLPGDAFKENAGTQVTTDILVFRKPLPGETFADAVPADQFTGVTRVELPAKTTPTKVGNVNKWMEENPSYRLGEQSFTSPLHPDAYHVARSAETDAEFVGQLTAAFEQFPAEIMSAPDTAGESSIAAELSPDNMPNGSYYINEDGALMRVENGAGHQVPSDKGARGFRRKTKKVQPIIRDFIKVKAALRQVLDRDMRGGDATEQRAQLNEAYDAFVKKHGPVNKQVVKTRKPNLQDYMGAWRTERERARGQGEPWSDGSFEYESFVADFRENHPKNNPPGVRALKEEYERQQEAAERRGETWDYGTFALSEMGDIESVKHPNLDAFKEDRDSYLVSALEEYDEVTGEGHKTDVFEKPVLGAKPQPQIRNATDALYSELNRTGKIDMDEIAALANVDREAAIAELQGKVFLEPNTEDHWVTADEYLSGNVKAKLATAREALSTDTDMMANVAALETVQPEPVPAAGIHMPLGAPWIPNKILNKFIESLGVPNPRVRYDAIGKKWIMDFQNHDKRFHHFDYGTQRWNFKKILQSVLTGSQIKVTTTVKTGDGERTIVLPKATKAAQNKADKIRVAWQQWIRANPDTEQALVDTYNDLVNTNVSPTFDGSYLQMPQAHLGWQWRPHQLSVIARIVQSGNTYVAHAVGAGKTAEMVGAAMELRRLGIKNKNMFVVPNHMLQQFSREWLELYPSAKLMVADEEGFHKDRRKQFVADAAAQDLDAIVITHSAFGMISVSPEWEAQMIQEEIDKLRDAIERSEDRITRKNAEAQVERLQEKLSGASARMRKMGDDVLTFEQMGVDQLFVDEAHEFRKQTIATTKGNVKGIDPQGSDMARDLLMKTRYLDSVYPGRSVVLASGTPITNTMGELWSLMQYLAPQDMANRGFDSFDAWAETFGETIDVLEQTPDGKHKLNSRFAKFNNVPELSNLVRSYMDSVTSQMLEKFVTRPQLKGGKRTAVIVPMSPRQEEYRQVLTKRREAIEARTGPPQKGDDIMLTVIGDGRKSAIDMRLIDGPNVEPDPAWPSKLDKMVDNIFKTYQETGEVSFHTPDREKGGYKDEPDFTGAGTQTVFLSLGVGDSMEFKLPAYIKQQLVARGVPANEIAIFGDAKNSVEKQRIFNDMNEGRLRVLIGTVGNMSTGVNAQQRLVAQHNLDPVWFPSADEQRNGRIIRQGNMNREIEIFDYSTEGTYDSQMWDLMFRKASFIEGFFTGDATLREIEDLGEASQYEQMKALTQSDPRISELTELNQKAERLRRLKSNVEQEGETLVRKLQQFRGQLREAVAKVAELEQDVELVEPIGDDGFSITVSGNEIFDKGGEAPKKGKTARQRAEDALRTIYDQAREKYLRGDGAPDGEVWAQYRGGVLVLKGKYSSTGDIVLKPEWRIGDSAIAIGGTNMGGIIQSLERRVPQFEAESLPYWTQERDRIKRLLEEQEGRQPEDFSEKDLEALDNIEDRLDEIRTALREEALASGKDEATVNSDAIAGLNEDENAAGKETTADMLDDHTDYGDADLVDADSARQARRERQAERARRRSGNRQSRSLKASVQELEASLEDGDFATDDASFDRVVVKRAYEKAKAALRSLGLDDKVALTVTERILDAAVNESAPAGFQVNAVIYLDGANPEIQVGIEALLRNGATVEGTINHEAIHALRYLGAFSETEWAALTKAARKDWIKRYDINEAYEGASDEIIVEEAIAKAFQEFWLGNKVPGVSGGGTLLSRAMARIRKIISALRQSFKRADIPAEDISAIFKDIQSGRRGRALETPSRSVNDWAEEITSSPEYRASMSRIRKAGRDALEQIHGPRDLPNNIKVEQPKGSEDLNVVARFLMTPKGMFRKWPELYQFVKKAEMAERKFDVRKNRLFKKYEKIRTGMSAAEFMDVTDALFEHDARQENPTRATLASLGLSPELVTRALQINKMFEEQGRLVDQHRRKMMPVVQQRKRMVWNRMKSLASSARVMSSQRFVQLYNRRAHLRRRMAAGASGQAAILAEIARIEAELQTIRMADPDVQAKMNSLKAEYDLLETQLAQTSVRTRKGYVPHKFFGSWRLYEKVGVDAKGNPVFSEITSDQGFFDNQSDAVAAARDFLQTNPGADLKIEPKQMKWPMDAKGVQVSDSAYFHTVNNVDKEMDAVAANLAASAGLDPDDVRDLIDDKAIVKGAVRRRMRRRIYAPGLRRTGARGYSRDLDKIMKAHIGQSLRYVMMDELKYDIISAIEKMGLSPYTRITQERPVLQGAIEQYFKDMNGEKQVMETALDEVLDMIGTRPLLGAMGATALGVVAGSAGSPLFATALGGYMGYRTYRALTKGGQFKTRALTGGMLSDMAHLKLGMALNLGSAVVNLTQTMLNTYPILGERWTSVGMKRLAEALAGGENHPYRVLMRRADISPDVNFTEANPGFFQKQGRAAQISMWAFQGAEQMNRGTAFLGAYARAEAKGASPGQAYREAMDVIAKTQHHYGMAAKPELLRNVLLRVPLQFKNFMFQQIGFMAGLRGSEIPRFLVAMALVGGLLAWPMLQVMDGIAEALTGYSLIAGIKAFALDQMDEDGMLPHEVATMIARGVPGVFVDISGRTGVGDKFLPTELRDFYGPFASTGAGAVELDKAGAGFADQMANLSPGLGNSLRTLEAMANGVPIERAYSSEFWGKIGDGEAVFDNPRLKGGMEYEPTNAELIWKTIGLRPIREAQLADIRDNLRRDVERRNQKVQPYLTRGVNGYRAGDKAAPAREVRAAAEDGVIVTPQQMLNALKRSQTARNIDQVRRAPKAVRAPYIEQQRNLDRVYGPQDQ